MPAHLEQPVSLPPLRHLPVRNFADAFTRRLLLHRGMTTELLEHRGRCPLRLRVRTQTLAVPRIRDQRLRRLLHLASAPQCLVRRTELVTREGTVVSRNWVIGRLPENNELVTVVTSHSVPLGRSLAVRGIPHRRTLLTAGLSDWHGPRGPLPAAARGYLLHPDGELPLYIEEMFNPAVVSPRQRSGSAPTVGRRLLTRAS